MQNDEGWLTHLFAGVESQSEIPSANHLHLKGKAKAVTPSLIYSSQWGQVKWLFYCPPGSPNRLNRISHIISIFKNTLILNQSSIHYVCCIYLSCNPVLFQMLYKTIQITKRSFNNVLTQTS